MRVTARRDAGRSDIMTGDAPIPRAVLTHPRDARSGRPVEQKPARTMLAIQSAGTRRFFDRVTYI
jgi:hypothetical protein